MKAGMLLWSFAVTCCWSMPAMAQSSATVVKARPALSVDKVKQGSSFQIAVVLDIDGGYHINSNRPSDAYLIATSLKIERLPGVVTSPVRYPKASLKKFGFSEKPLSVYEGRAVLKIPARALAGLATGNHTLHAKLTVQACNDQACLQPKTVPVEIAIEVVPASAQVTSTNTDLFGPARDR